MTVNVAPPQGPAIDGNAPDTRPVQVSFAHVSKAYRQRLVRTVTALDDVSLDVRKGEIFGIIGRSGAGKSSLVRLVNGLERATSGTVTVNGQDVGRLAQAGLMALRRRTGMIFQGFNLLSSQTAEDNVALPLRFAGLGTAEARRRAQAALDQVGMADKAHAYPARLSGGQKQRTAIARALVQGPDLLLSDEATSALDPETTASILALLKDINRRLGLTIILITHEMEVIRAVADRVAVIEQGRIAESGEVWRVFGSPQHEATRALLHSSAVNPARDLPQAQGQTVLAVRFTGRTQVAPDLHAIAAAAGPGARLLSAALGPLQGRAFGTLLIALPVAADVPGARLRLQAAAPDAEIEAHAA